MSRLKTLFDTKKKDVLNIYCTAGYPKLENTLMVMQALQEHGADIIELGMPYSDPLADGPVIQQSSQQALAQGMTLQKLFQQLEKMRETVSIPVVLMGYMNPVLQYGFEQFCEQAARLGIDGLILPDLPEHEFETIYGKIIRDKGLDFIFLITPETSVERIRRLDALSSGFLYAVSSSSTTGADKKMGEVTSYLGRLKEMKLKNPILVGFGIKDRQSFLSACETADGAIIGSAYIKALGTGEEVKKTTARFLQEILNDNQ